MSKIFKVGIAGLDYGSSVHAPAFQKLSNVEVVAIAGTTMQKARSVADGLSIPHPCDQYEDIFDYDLDIAGIALPPQIGEKAIQYALNYRIPIFAEKPLTADHELAERLADIAAENGVPTAVDLQYAELKAFKELKKALDNNKIGKLKDIQVTWSRMSFGQKTSHWSWKTDKNRAGGVLNMMANQFFYLTEWLAGAVKSIYCSAKYDATEKFTPDGEEAAEDTVHLELELKSGVKVVADISNADPDMSGHHWVLTGDKGQLFIDNPSADYMRGFTLHISKKEGEKKPVFIDERGTGVDVRILASNSLLTRFMDAIKKEKTFVPGFKEAARVQLLVDRARESAESGKKIKI